MEIDDELNIIKNILKKIVFEINKNIIDEDKILNEELDSFALIELMTKIENYFLINISPEEFNSENFSTYFILAKLIREKIAHKQTKM